MRVVVRTVTATFESLPAVGRTSAARHIRLRQTHPVPPRVLCSRRKGRASAGLARRGDVDVVPFVEGVLCPRGDGAAAVRLPLLARRGRGHCLGRERRVSLCHDRDRVLGGDEARDPAQVRLPRSLSDDDDGVALWGRGGGVGMGMG